MSADTMHGRVSRQAGQVLALKQFQGNARTASVRTQDSRLFVVQWIERGPPKAEMQVRFLPGRPKKALLPNVDASGKPASKPAKFTSQIHQPNSPTDQEVRPAALGFSQEFLCP